MTDEQYAARLTEIVEEVWVRGYDDCGGDTWQYDAATDTITHPPKSEIIHDFVTEIIRATNIDAAANPEGIIMNPDLRLEALHCALKTVAGGETAKQIIERAQAYYDFLAS